MKTKIVDTLANVADMTLTGMLLTLPLWIVALGGSAIVGIMYIFK